MTEYTTDYTSQFPSGFMAPNIQAERRDDSPATVAGARDFNRHDVEILRIQEVIGNIPAAQSGAPNPTGDMLTILYNNYQNIQNIFGGSGLAGNKIEFHDTPSDTNYQFVQWFAEWMGIWSDLSSGGTPSVTEIMKMILQNKYDVEVLFDPKFLYPAERWWVGKSDPDEYFFQYYPDGTEYIYCGFTGSVPKKPIGGGCNLNNRPWPVYEVYDVDDGGWLQGYQTLPSGHQLWFFAFPAYGDNSTGVGLSKIDEDHLLGLFGNSPYELAGGGSTALVLTSGSPIATFPTGNPPQPAPPPPHGIPSGYPGPIDDLPPWVDPDAGLWEPIPDSDTGAPVEISNLIVPTPLKAIHDGKGTVQLSSIEMQAVPPMPYSGFATPNVWKQVGSELLWGIDLQVDFAKMCLVGPPECWLNIYATIACHAAAGGPYSFNNVGFVAYKMDYAPTPGTTSSKRIDFGGFLGVSLLPGQYITVPVAQMYLDNKALIEGHLFDDPPVSAPPFAVIGFSAELGGYKR